MRERHLTYITLYEEASERISELDDVVSVLESKLKIYKAVIDMLTKVKRKIDGENNII